MTSAGLQGTKAERLTQASLLAQEKMDEILADKDSQGYAYVDSAIAAQGYDDTLTVAPAQYTRTVTAVDTSYDGIAYKEVAVEVSTTHISNVLLRTWLTDL